MQLIELRQLLLHGQWRKTVKCVVPDVYGTRTTYTILIAQ